VVLSGLPLDPSVGRAAPGPMFQSKEKLQEDVRSLVEALRRLGEGRYAVLFDPKGVLLESAEERLAEGQWVLRRLIQARAEDLFRLPAALHGGQEMEDLFADWESDEFFLAFLNGKVGLLVACPDAQRLQDESGELLKILADRLLRLNPAWRLDEKGRGLFFGSPRLDTVVVGRPNG
jgi:hypothetical protein